MDDIPSSPPRRSLLQEIRQPMLEPILHPTPRRLRWLALCTALGHPVFYVAWTHWLPQPFESLALRLTMSLLGWILLFSPAATKTPPSQLSALFIGMVIWLTVPVFFTWMYFCNGRSEVWFATLVTVFPITYQLLDWRIATAALASGLGTGWILLLMINPPHTSATAELAPTHAVVLCFSWGISLAMAVSANSLRLEQLRQTLGTMGILAHELRTPFATVTLIGDALRHETSKLTGNTRKVLEELASRLHSIVRNMNHQIDLQIRNAQLLSLPEERDRLSAAGVALEAVKTFPYRNARERACVELRVKADFEFFGEEALVVQVLTNLLKNALRALASQTTLSQPGDLVVEVDAIGRWGRIVVADRGPGISPQVRSRLFQMFNSSHRGSGHGLGLAFCQRVVQNIDGQIRAESQPGEGTRFIIDLPLHARAAPRARTAHAAS